jgi:hypothetical protein
LTFELCPYRLQFLARDRISFPAGNAGNVLRGWFGHTLRKVAPLHYGRIFEPRAAGTGPSGFGNWPRPFVFRAANLDGRTIEPGQPFWFAIHMFDLRRPMIVHFEAAFAHLAGEGLGPLRGRADLAGVETLDNVSIPLDPGPEGSYRVQVEFRTPTELKGAELATQPDFSVLFGRARDRISTLRALYGAGPLDIDFRSMGQRTSAVRLTRSELAHVAAYRRSSRTGQVHPIGGFVGMAEYEGALAEFLPYLEAAHWTGVGRQCVWGKGEIVVSRL